MSIEAKTFGVMVGVCLFVLYWVYMSAKRAQREKNRKPRTIATTEHVTIKDDLGPYGLDHLIDGTKPEEGDTVLLTRQIGGGHYNGPWVASRGFWARATIQNEYGMWLIPTAGKQWSNTLWLFTGDASGWQRLGPNSARDNRLSTLSLESIIPNNPMETAAYFVTINLSEESLTGSSRDDCLHHMVTSHVISEVQASLLRYKAENLIDFASTLRGGREPTDWVTQVRTFMGTLRQARTRLLVSRPIERGAGQPDDAMLRRMGLNPAALGFTRPADLSSTDDFLLAAGQPKEEEEPLRLSRYERPPVI